MTGYAVKMDLIRDYWDRRPCNIRHGLGRPGSLDWSRMVSFRKRLVEPHIPGFAQFARWKGKQVLEIGCGIGSDTLSFAKAGADVDAVDLSPQSAMWTQRRLNVEKLKARVYCTNAEQWLPGGPLTYDLIYSFGVLHHTPHPLAVLKLCRELLRPEGELRIMLYALWSLKNLEGQQPEAQAGCPLARRYTKRTARALLKAAGFEVLSICKRHVFRFKVPEYMQYRHVERPLCRFTPAFLLAGLERVLGDHLLIVAKKVYV